MSNQEILKAKESERVKVLTYTRVMGYHRPTESFNIGKQGEHKDRVQFTEGHSVKC